MYSGRFIFYRKTTEALHVLVALEPCASMLIRRIPRIDPTPNVSLFDRGERLDPPEVDSIVVLVWSVRYLCLAVEELTPR